MSNTRKEIIYQKISDLDDRLIIARAAFHKMTNLYDQLIDAEERDENYADHLREIKSKVYESRVILQNIKQEKESLVSELRAVKADLHDGQAEVNNTEEQEALHRGYRI